MYSGFILRSILGCSSLGTYHTIQRPMKLEGFRALGFRVRSFRVKGLLSFPGTQKLDKLVLIGQRRYSRAACDHTECVSPTVAESVGGGGKHPKYTEATLG